MLRNYLYDEMCNVLDDYLVVLSIARMKDVVTSYDVANDLFQWGLPTKNREREGSAYEGTIPYVRASYTRTSE